MAKKKSVKTEPVKHIGIADETYFDESTKTFLTSNGKGGFLSVNETQMQNIVSQFKLPDDIDANEARAMAKRAVVNCMFHHAVAYAGPIAGYPCGLLKTGQGDILVSVPTVPPRPVPGSCDATLAFFRTVYGMESYRLFYWMRAALDSLRAGPPFRPSQCLALVGGPGSGKSLTQTFITSLFGGRSAKAYAYLAGKTEFNGNLVGAAHLILEDDQSSMDPRNRRALGTSIKGIVANHSHRIRRMHREAFDVSPFWRLSISLNHEPEALSVLPHLDESIRDKITALHAVGKPAIFRNEDNKIKKRWWDIILRELPHFVHYLDALKIPKQIQSSRYGVAEYCTKWVSDNLTDISEENVLLDLLLRGLESNSWEAEFTGTASEIEKALFSGPCGAQAKRLLTWPTACGVYLSRIQTSHPDKVTSSRHNTRGRIYTINLAKGEDEE